ncbi:hypothetical protein L249_2218 [Ophiocordyceps polyrhachis-furcata BCC 54312]|uniref:DASH complex subunit DAD3 n=1 Tax=Ophiocordyceps polyrhachis-furcata BCC 54312 TaxID=1330021 RepID=A0A367LR16_9HYPO|nr:hypothetical protein L249_2218 [Ophiocordyceps polyrhachis-furcata BCC 54312]
MTTRLFFLSSSSSHLLPLILPSTNSKNGPQPRLNLVLLLPPVPTPDLSPLEQQVLEEYEKLATNMKQLATALQELASKPAAEIVDGLRLLERKTSLAFTLLKASGGGAPWR